MKKIAIYMRVGTAKQLTQVELVTERVSNLPSTSHYVIKKIKK